MEMVSTIFYFIGLIMVSVAFGQYTNVTEYGFMILGSGCMGYAILTAIASYFGGKNG